jgi:hypothetical protein
MINDKLKILIEELFYALTVSLAIFGVMEIIRPRLVLAYINLSWLLLAWLVIGVLYLFIDKNK